MSARPTATLTRTGTPPRPSAAHATCAWCGVDFVTIGDLLDHVDAGHLTSG